MVIEQYCPELNCLGTANSALEGKRLAEEYKPDIVFLDINMPVLDGFDFLEMLPEKNFMLVFVTAHEEFAIEAIRVNAVDYLVKPINIDELQSCVKRLLLKKEELQSKNILQPQSKVIVPQPNGFTTIETEEIIRLEGDDCYTHVYLSDGKKIMVSRTLKEFENVLNEEMFFRIHKSHIINLSYFKEFTQLDGGFAIMKDGSKLEVSRRKQKEFLKKVKAYLTR